MEDITKYDLRAEAEKINAEYFGGRLDLKFPFEYSTLRMSYGRTHGSRFYDSGKVVVKKVQITNLYNLSYEKFRGIMAHELIHVELLQDQKWQTEHGPDFMAELRRIRSEGLDVPLGEDIKDVEVDSGRTLKKKVFFITWMAHGKYYAQFVRDWGDTGSRDWEILIGNLQYKYIGDQEKVSLPLYFGSTADAGIRAYPIAKTLGTGLKTRLAVTIREPEYAALVNQADQRFKVYADKMVEDLSFLSAKKKAAS